VLLGDSGVGKSGLGLVLSGQPFEPTESTHGRRVWDFDRFEAPTPTGTETREILLWDLAGQPGYRIVHQLHLGEVALALIVFDAGSDIDVFAGVRHWARALKQVTQGREGTALAPKVFLVAARTDRGGRGVSRERVQRLIDEFGFEPQYFETSAKEGWGIEELRQAIHEAIPWDELPRVNSSELFYLIKEFLKEFLIAETASGRLLATAEDLYAALLRQHPNLGGSGDRRSQFEACIGLVAARGLISRLSFGGLVLLQPELLDAYASSLVNAARDQPDGIGSLPEADARSGNFRMAAGERIGDKEQEKLLCIATVEELLRQEVVLRESTEDGPLLVFPAQFRRDWPEAPEPPDKDLVFTFEGPVANVYATLAVRLSHGGRFRRKEMYRNAVIYSPAEGRGTCGLFLRDFGEGRAELSLFYPERPSQETQDTFEDYVSAHLHRRALPKTIQRRRTFRCGNCGTVVPDASAEKRRNRRLMTIPCANCDNPVSLEDRAEDELRQVSPAVQAIDQEADVRRYLAAAQLALAGKRKTGDYDVYICLGDEDRSLIQEVARGLLDLGTLCWPDDWDPSEASRRPAAAGQVATIKWAVIVVGPGCAAPWKDPDREALLRAFVDRQAPIVMYLFPGATEEPLPAYLTQVTRLDLRGQPSDAAERRPGTEPKVSLFGGGIRAADAFLKYSQAQIGIPWTMLMASRPPELDRRQAIQVELIDGRAVPIGAEIPYDRLQLRRIKLRDVKCLESLDLALVNDRGEPRRWTLLLGENGCGKTTLLRSLALLTGGSGAFGVLIGNPDDWIRQGQSSCSIEGEFSLGRGRPQVFELAWSRGWSLAQVIASNQQTFMALDDLLAQTARNFLAAGYGCSRHLSRMVPAGGEGDRPGDPRAAAVATLFSADALMYPLQAFARELEVRRQSQSGYVLQLMPSVEDVSGIPTEGKNLIILAGVDQVLHFRIFDGDGRKVVDKDEKSLTEKARPIEDLRKQLASLWPPHELTRSEKGLVIEGVTSIVGHPRQGLAIIRDMLKDLLPEMEVPEVDPEWKDLVFPTADGRLPLAQLSDGYQNMAAWCGDLLYRIFTATGAETDPARAHGLLLIDEIDLHLHPVWQRQLRRFLRDKLPNFQIVGTTHSPLTAQQSAPGELFTVQRPAPGQPPKLVPFRGDPRLFLLQQILTSSAFKLPTEDSEFVENQREEFHRLRDQPARTPDEQEQMDRLRDQIEDLPYPGNALVDYEKEHKALLERIAQALESGDNGPAPSPPATPVKASAKATRTGKSARKRRAR
jgi:GTPase SAR1 family protein